MKKIILVLFLLPFFAFGQRDSIQKGLDFTCFVSNNGYNLNFNPNFFFKWGKHGLGAGPVFTMLPIPYRSEESNIKLTGIHAFYKIHPNSEGKCFTFYFRYDLVYNMYRDLFYSYALKDNRLENYLGYGFNLRVYKNIFIHQHLGLGPHYIVRKYTGPSGTISSSKDWEEGAIGGIGVGLVF